MTQLVIRLLLVLYYAFNISMLQVYSRTAIAPIRHPARCKEVHKPASYLTWRVFYCSTKCGEIQWYSHKSVAWQCLGSMEHLTNPTTQLKKTSRLERLAFPKLGDIAINIIKSSQVSGRYLFCEMKTTCW